MSNEKIFVQVIDKIRNHGKDFTFHDNKRIKHSMIGKAFTSGFWVFLKKR